MADVLGMESVDVLARVDAVDQLGRIPMPGQRQLDEDAVDLRIGIEPIDEGEQLLVAGVGRQVIVDRTDPDLLRGTASRQCSRAAGSVGFAWLLIASMATDGHPACAGLPAGPGQVGRGAA